MATRFVQSVLVAIALSCLLTLVVQADGPLVREHYSGTDSFSFDDCGFVIDGEVTFRGLFMLKQGRQGDLTPYLFNNYANHIVYTNPANGMWFTLDQNGLYKDLHITNVGGTIHAFEAINVGSQDLITDMDGNVVLHNRGLLRFRFTVDTKGDSDLSNDEFLTDFELVEDRGKHPGLNLPFCEIASDLLF
jgi:hypothetical protein